MFPEQSELTLMTSSGFFKGFILRNVEILPQSHTVIELFSLPNFMCTNGEASWELSLLNADEIVVFW